MNAGPSEKQLKNADWMISAGEIFTLIPYAQLILENAKLYKINDDLLNEIACFLVKDFSSFAYNMILEHDLTEEQDRIFHKMMKKPDSDRSSFESLWKNEVFALKDIYK